MAKMKVRKPRIVTDVDNSQVMPVENLRNAIILNARNDYVASYKELVKASQRHNRMTEDQKNKVNGHIRMTLEIEAFFNGDWYSTITNVSGHQCLRQIQSEAARLYGSLDMGRLRRIMAK